MENTHSMWCFNTNILECITGTLHWDMSRVIKKGFHWFRGNLFFSDYPQNHSGFLLNCYIFSDMRFVLGKYH